MLHESWLIGQVECLLGIKGAFPVALSRLKPSPGIHLEFAAGIPAWGLEEHEAI